MRFIAALFALCLAGPVLAAPNWQKFSEHQNLTVEVDASSVNKRIHNGGQEIWARLRLTLVQEAPAINGKRGAYFISEMTAICKDDILMINTVHLYTKDHELLDSDQPVGPVVNPHIEDNFITMYLAHVCNTAKTGKPAPYV